MANLAKVISNFTWSELRAVTNSAAARATVLIPIIGYLIIFNGNIIHYLNVVKEVGGAEPEEAHVSSRLLLVYLGLTLVAIGAALYQLFCPPDVKYYGDTNAYVGGVTPTIKDYRFRAMEDRLRKSIFKDRYMDVRNMYKGIKEEKDFTDEDKATINNGVLHVYFEYLNKENFPARCIAGWAFVLGYCVLLIPSLGIVARVLGLIFKTLFSDPGSFF